MACQIREFTPADASAVASMFTEWDPAWPGTFTGGVPITPDWLLENRLRYSILATFLAVHDEKVVGLCSLQEGVSGQSAAYVGLLGVSPAFQGRRLGRDLLRAVLDRSVELGYDRLDLDTWAGNVQAVPLYKKMRFFWAPGTQVYMHNYLPLILRQDYARSFFEDDDWYHCFQRDLAVKPDEHLEAGMKVFRYARAANPTGAPLAAIAGAMIFPTMGGERDGSVVHFERQGRRSRNSSGGMIANCGHWRAVERQLAERVLVIVARAPRTELQLIEMGTAGPSIGFGNARSELEPDGVVEASVFLVIARSMEQALLYRALSDT